MAPQDDTLQDRMFPNAENVSYKALLSMDLSRFLMKMFPTPLFLSEGSRWDHMIRRGLPFITSKFMVSKALSAKTNKQICCTYFHFLRDLIILVVWHVGNLIKYMFKIKDKTR